MRPVAFEVAVPDPPELTAVTRTRSRRSTSVLVATYVFEVAPEMEEHEDSAVVVQRCHWYEKVIGCEPDQVPLPAVRVRPTRRVPEIVGSTVLRGGAIT